jgi:hypothetical protein
MILAAVKQALRSAWWATIAGVGALVIGLAVFLVYALSDVLAGHRDPRLVARQCELDPQMSIDDVAGRPVHGDFGHPTDFSQRS